MAPLPNDTAAGIHSPEISKKTLKRSRRSVATAAEAAEIVRRLIEDNRERNTKNARIMAKYNAESPYKPSELKAEGLEGQSNFSTKPLSTLVDKIAPRFVKAIDSARYLTASYLPDNTPGASTKTEFARTEITKTIRAHRQYKSTVNQISQENALFGYCAAAYTDETDWWPSFFRQDEFFVPQGAKQTADTFQVFALKETFLPHALFEKISGSREDADNAGWHIENVVAAVNDAAPAKADTTDNLRQYEDLVRESSVAMSMSRGAKIIEAYHLFAQEVDGKVTHWILEGKEYNELFYAEDQFDSMFDVVAPFTFQQANGTLHGSKGIGREVYNMAAVLDRSRNSIVDRLQLSGKLIFRGDEKLLRRFRMSVVGNAVLYPSSYEIQQAKLEGNVEPFLKLDQYLIQLLDQMVGGATPKEFMGERVTKAAVELYASREEERRDSTLDRFLSCFADMVSTIQKRLLDPECSDEAAKTLRSKLLTRLTPEEVEYLRKQPAVSTVDDYTERENQIIAAVATESQANPLFNQRELQRRKLAALLGADFADAVLLPENDPTESAEQSRLQMMESALLQLGKQVAVSPRDNHLIHLGVLYADASEVAPNVVSDPAAHAYLTNLVTHARAHLETAKATGAKNPELQEVEKQISAIEKQLAEVSAMAPQGGQPPV